MTDLTDLTNLAADTLIADFALSPHPEGGHYRQTYRSDDLVETPRGPRPASTAILFLLRAGERSHWHRIASDELWYFHQGQPLEIWEIGEDGGLSVTRLSQAAPQHCVKAGRWFAARLASGQGFGLVSCGVAPGFDFADFELADCLEDLALTSSLDAAQNQAVRAFLVRSSANRDLP